MTQKQRILHCLADAYRCGEGVSNGHLLFKMKIGRFGGRIKELRNDGNIEIESIHEGGSLWSYRLHTDPTEIDFEKCRLEPIAPVKPGETMELRL